MDMKIRIISGHVADLDVFIFEDTVTVLRGQDALVLGHHVPNYGTALQDLVTRPGFKLGWVRMEDDMEIIYLYDINDDLFGYAVNLDDPYLSEWGYAPFSRSGEEPA